MTKIISFSGVSNSGKTTLITGLCKILIPEFKVGVIKHDPKNKVVFDTIGKDSYKFFESGANVVVVSPTQTTIRLQKGLQNDFMADLLNRCEPLDYIFIEGFKTMPYRRICVVRGDFVDSDVENANAIAVIDVANLAQNPAFQGKTILNLDNHRGVLEWIDSLKW